VDVEEDAVERAGGGEPLQRLGLERVVGVGQHRAARHGGGVHQRHPLHVARPFVLGDIGPAEEVVAVQQFLAAHDVELLQRGAVQAERAALDGDAGDRDAEPAICPGWGLVGHDGALPC
jgi:hypothetical protein